MLLHNSDRPIESISCNVRATKSYIVECCTIFFGFSWNILLLPFTKVLGQSDQLLKESLQNSDEKTMVSEFAILAQKLSQN